MAPLGVIVVDTEGEDPCKNAGGHDGGGMSPLRVTVVNEALQIDGCHLFTRRDEEDAMGRSRYRPHLKALRD